MNSLFWIGQALTAFVALEHLGFLVLEMFLWNTPRGHAVFGLTAEFAAESAPLAANQGLYNGFLAAGLLWGLLLGGSPFAFQVKVFFLACVVIAGLYGGITTKSTILYIQALPGIIGLLLVLAAPR